MCDEDKYVDLKVWDFYHSQCWTSDLLLSNLNLQIMTLTQNVTAWWHDLAYFFRMLLACVT